MLRSDIPSRQLLLEDVLQRLACSLLERAGHKVHLESVQGRQRVNERAFIRPEALPGCEHVPRNCDGDPPWSPFESSRRRIGHYSPAAG